MSTGQMTPGDPSLRRAFASVAAVPSSSMLKVAACAASNLPRPYCGGAAQSFKPPHMGGRHFVRVAVELTYSRADGSYIKRLAQLSKTQLLIPDDWGLEPLLPA